MIKDKKRLAFTLAELLIVLGITGVLSACILGAVSTMKPDKTKIMYLKVYDELTRSVSSIAANTALYPVCMTVSGDDSVACYNNSLINTAEPYLTYFKSMKGDTKLCQLVGFTMNATTSCKSSSYSYSDSTFASNVSFTTPNGMKWIITPKTRSVGAAEGKFQSDVFVDVDETKNSSNCMFSSSCKKPDRFKFMIAANGTVVPADPMGQYYINTRKNFTKSKNAKVEGSVATVLDTSLLSFAYKPCVSTYDDGSYVKKWDEEDLLEKPDEIPDTPQADICTTKLTTKNYLAAITNNVHTNTSSKNVWFPSKTTEKFATSSNYTWARLHERDVAMLLDLSEKKNDRSEWDRGRSGEVTTQFTNLTYDIRDTLKNYSMIDKSFDGAIMEQSRAAVVSKYVSPGPVTYSKRHGSIEYNLMKNALWGDEGSKYRHRIAAGYDRDGNTEAAYAVLVKDVIDDMLSDFYQKRCSY